MKKLLNIITLTLVLLSNANGAGLSSGIDSLELTNFGLLEVNVVETSDLSSTAAGGFNQADELVFTKETNRVPAVKKQTFGTEFLVHGEPKGKRIKIGFKVLHPEINGRSSSAAQVNVDIGEREIYFYRFDEDVELVEGIWTFQFIHLDERRVLLERSFEVYKPGN